MSVTKRFLLLLCTGIPFLGLCVLFDIHAIFFVLYNMLCMGLLAIDYFVSPAAESFTVHRQDSNTLYYKAVNTIQLKVTSHAQRPVTMEISDDVPDRHFKIKRKTNTCIAAPGQETEFQYELIPTKRGSFLFQNIYIRYTGFLGLCKKYTSYAKPMHFMVYPDLRDMSKYRFAARRLLYTGDGRNALGVIRGTTTEFESMREYVNGDDYRKINWIITARERKLMINQYERERNQPVFMMIDTGRPMSYSVKGYKKLDYAIHAALILADIVNQNGDMSGLMVFDTAVKSVVPPGKGQAHRNSLMEVLYHLEDTNKTSNYENAFFSFCGTQKRQSIVFIFTDFTSMEEAQDLADSLSIIKKRHTPIIVLMKNTGLADIVQSDKPDLKDTKIVNGLKEAYRKGTAMEFQEEHKNIIKALHARGIYCMESSVDEFALTLVNQYLYVRQI